MSDNNSPNVCKDRMRVFITLGKPLSKSREDGGIKGALETLHTV